MEILPKTIRMSFHDTDHDFMDPGDDAARRMKAEAIAFLDDGRSAKG